MRRMSALILCILVVSGVEAQDLENVMMILGTTDPEDMTEQDMERFETLYRHPVPVNSADAASLESSGLFSAFQIASLLDYRERHGNVLSFMEMASIDGFDLQWVKSIAPFVQLDENPPSAGQFFSGDVAFRAGTKVYTEDCEAKWNYGVRTRLSFLNRCDVGLSASRPNDARHLKPECYSGFLSWKGRTVRLIVGDFNARFGQGLCLWNSSFSSSLATPSSFMKRPSGVTPASSFTGSTALTGLAASVSAGKWRLSVLSYLPDVKKELFKLIACVPCVNLTRFGRAGHVSMTHTMEFSGLESRSFRIPHMKTSADASVCLRGVNMYGEVMYDWVLRQAAAVAGCDFQCEESLRLATRMRYIPSDNDWGLTLGGELAEGTHNGTMTLDASYYPEGKSGASGACFQAKANMLWQWKMTGSMTLKLRLSERVRSWGQTFRTDLRTDFSYQADEWSAAVRLNVLQCVSVAFLGYAEGGYKWRGLAAYLRLGLFRIDCWEDRIYVYERDAPGNFNVPAYNGRGVWAASYVSWKLRRKSTLYLRAAIKKPGNAELKFMMKVLF